MPNTIELIPIKGERGAREIIVAGKRWGKIEAQGHGCHGYSYRFLQAHTDGNAYWIEREAWKGHFKPIDFFPKKPDRYERAVNKAKAEPLDDQLRKAVDDLIKKKQLRDPDIVAEEAARQSEEYRKRVAEINREEARAFEERAAACLAPVSDEIGDNVKAEMIASIIAAMRWAQTQ